MSLDLGRASAALEAALAVAELAADARRCRARIDWVLEDAGHTLTLWPGEVQGARITVYAQSAVLGQALAATPPVGHQSFGALRRQCAGFRIDADELALAQVWPFMERLLEYWRAKVNGIAPTASRQPVDLGAMAHIRGAYVPLDAQQRDWVYGERTGDPGAPAVLMLHTAGADARQWHGLMLQEPLRRDWQLHAFDLPGHGRSPLPQGSANWDWRLTQAQYERWVLAYLDAAGLDKVLLLGCSMGSAIGLVLLARHPGRFAGAVLLEAPYCSPGRRSPYLNHPEVHGGRLSAAWVGALLSPTSPQWGRDRATWIYSQGAPGVYDGDLAFYSDDFDAHEYTGHIDTRQTPLWLLTGDYDYSATPADTQRVAQEIPGAQFRQLSGFGHFPMVENPQGLLPHLIEPFAHIRARF